MLSLLSPMSYGSGAAKAGEGEDAGAAAPAPSPAIPPAIPPPPPPIPPPRSPLLSLAPPPLGAECSVAAAWRLRVACSSSTAATRRAPSPPCASPRSLPHCRLPPTRPRAACRRARSLRRSRPLSCCRLPSRPRQPRSRLRRRPRRPSSRCRCRAERGVVCAVH